MKFANWILKTNVNRVIYLFYSPVALLLFIPLTPFYNNMDILWIPIVFVFLIIFLLYFVFTVLVGKELILKDNIRYTNQSVNVFLFHSSFSLLVLLVVILLASINPGEFPFLLLMIFLISEAFRYYRMAKLIVSLENKRKVNFREYMLTFYLILNPLIGSWNLHARLKALLIEKENFKTPIKVH